MQQAELLINSNQASIALNKLDKLSFSSNPGTMYRYHIAYADALKNLNKADQSINHRLKALTIKPHSLSQWALIIAQEEKAGSAIVYPYYRANLNNFSHQVKLFLTAKLSCTQTSIHLKWDEAITFASQSNYNPIFINTLIVTAFIRNPEALNKIEAVLFEKLTPFNKPILLRSFRQLALIYYKTGNRKKINHLSQRTSFNDETWNLAITFGKGDPLNGLTHRANILTSSFLRFYKNQSDPNGLRTLFPEKDLCGDIFLPFFFESEYSKNGFFRVICDKRLHSILSRSFPTIQFLPKTPRRQKESNLSAFEGLPTGLDQFIDTNTNNKIRNSNFFNITANQYFHDEACQRNRLHGWLKPDNQKAQYWRNFFKKEKGRRLVGFSASTTLHSPSRNKYMVDLEHWGSIFKIPNTTFINLNSHLTKSDLDYINNKFGIEVLTIESVDLYNDFESLLALMSALDFAIIPSNNMMDLAAALALDSLVFSPTNIMSNWVPKGHSNYIFSSHTKFITPINSRENHKSMVARASTYIKQQLNNE